MVVLVGTRSLVRRPEPGYETNPSRPWRLPVADQVQSSGARSGANSGAGYHVEWPGRVRNRALDNRIRVGRLRYRSRGLASDVGRSHRPASKDVDAGGLRGARGQISEDASARSYSETD